MALPTPSVAAGVLFRFLKDKMGSWLLAIGYFAICWLLLWLLYRKKVNLSYCKYTYLMIIVRITL